MGSASRAFWSSPLFAASTVVHGAAAALIVARPSAWPWALSGLAANHVVLSTAGLLPRAGWLGPNVTRVPSPEPDTLSLTFDDGPDPDITPRVLDLLAAGPHRATFFCVGSRVTAHPDVARAIVAAGHRIENHTATHPNGFAFRGPGGMRREVEGAQEAIAAVTGRRPIWFRAPAGIQNPFLPFVLASAGLSLVSWTRRGFDTVTPDAAAVAARLIGPGLRAGDILLLHDRVPVSLAALPHVLDAMARAGLRSEPLPSVI